MARAQASVTLLHGEISPEHYRGGLPMTDYNATCAHFVEEITVSGLLNPLGGVGNYFCEALRRVLKSGRKLKSRHEALLLADALNITGIYRDWFLGDWISDGGYVWWAPGDITKCSHGGPDTKRCSCPRTSAARLAKTVKKTTKVRKVGQDRIL
jgi:hypothetical protein